LLQLNQKTEQKGDGRSHDTIWLQCVTALDQYANKSFEELRWEDMDPQGASASAGVMYGTGAQQNAFGAGM